MRFAFGLSLMLLMAPPVARADSLIMVDQASGHAIGGNNYSAIVQLGNDNRAEAEQRGGWNVLRLNQNGDGNRAVIQQFGTSGSVSYTQQGNGLGVTVTQTGNHPPAVSITQKRGG